MDSLEKMRIAMTGYFSAEKTEGLVFTLIGLAAIIASVLIYRAASGYRGMILPLALIALIQIGVGGTVFLRTDSQVSALLKQMSVSAGAYRQEELARMDAVMKNFKIYKWMEISLLAAGVALALAFRHRDFLYALGIGLIIQPAVMLVMDLIAERRAEQYIGAIREFMK